MIIMRQISAANLVFLAAASLTREHPDRRDLTHEEIRRRAYELEPEPGQSDHTIRAHISSHCVANKKSDPGKHRKLFINDNGTYRLYRQGDPCDPGRKNGPIAPQPGEVPAKYHELPDWYNSTCENRTGEDWFASLHGLGAEAWKQLGGGEKFIRELRSNWDREEAPAQSKKKAV
jgi:hypothetical protein